MKKQLVLTSAMAATLSALPGCSSNPDWEANTWADQDTAICVDQAGNRIDDDYCDDRSGRSGYYGGSRWYYINRGSAIPYYGDSINDKRYGFSGSDRPKAGTTYAKAPTTTAVTRSTAVSRGGFGSSSSSYGSGRS